MARLTEIERARVSEWCRVAGHLALAQAVGLEVSTIHQIKRGCALSAATRDRILAVIDTPPEPRRCACGTELDHPARIRCAACAAAHSVAYGRAYQRAAYHARKVQARSQVAPACRACGAPEARDGRLVYCTARCCPPRLP